jgi:hypothetical protein
MEALEEMQTSWSISRISVFIYKMYYFLYGNCVVPIVIEEGEW